MELSQVAGYGFAAVALLGTVLGLIFGAIFLFGGGSVAGIAIFLSSLLLAAGGALALPQVRARLNGSVSMDLEGIAGGGVVVGLAVLSMVLFIGGIAGGAIMADPVDGTGSESGVVEETVTPTASESTATATEEPTSTATPSATSTATSSPSPTPSPSPTETLSDKEQAEQDLREGFQESDSNYRDGVREVDTLDGYGGRDGYSIDLRYDLRVDGFGDLEDDAEHRAGSVAVSVLESMSDTRAENVTAVAIYAYVPTDDGESAVSTKIVIDMDVVRSTDWSSYTWQELRDDADQYKFNSHLYE